jgi:succinate dehydrogenase / fumarate reductase iron-sulfur subunit
MSEMRFKLKVWRQASPNVAGAFEHYEVGGILPEMSFLEMLDQVNEDLTLAGKDPIAVDSDCREGICGACGLMIGGVAHGPKALATTCELRMRAFTPGDEITIEPWRASAMPIVKDLVVDRTAFDRIIAAGGYVSVNAGSARDANEILIGKPDADAAMDAAVCIGCAACVAACPNASASLFTAAKIAQFAVLPQGDPERGQRVSKMVAQMDSEGFGDCSNHGECEAVCPKGISITHIGVMRREYARSLITGSGQ